MDGKSRPLLTQKKKGTVLSFVPGFSSSTDNFRRLLASSLWPECDCVYAPSVKDMVPKGNIEKSGPDVGDFFSKKLKRQVQYKSEMEKSFFQMLEKSEDVLWYLEQPVRINCFKGRERVVHIPDVLVALEHNRFVIVEIRSVSTMTEPGHVDQYFALKNYCSALGWGLLITDGRYSFFQLNEHKLRFALLSEVRAKLAHGPINYDDYREIESLHKVSKLDFAAMLVQERLEHSVKPFRLARRPGELARSETVSASVTVKRGKPCPGPTDLRLPVL